MLKIIALALLLSSCSSTKVAMMNNSYHFDRNPQTNEVHNSFIVEHEVGSGVVGIGPYVNSLGKNAEIFYVGTDNFMVGIGNNYDTRSGYRGIAGIPFDFNISKGVVTRVFVTPVLVMWGLVIGEF